jgi:V/A-type H+-transporting ATPase subunit E
MITMGVEEVVEKILADAKAEAEKIKKQADQKESAEKEKLALQLDEYGKQTQAIAEKAGKDKKSHLLAAARMQIAKDLLTEKRKILDEIFARAKNKLQKLPDQEYKKIMTKLMLNTVETGDEEVIVDKNETRIDHSFIKDINRKLGPGYKGNLRLSEQKADLGAGFILKRGKIKNNVSIEVLLAKARKELEIELAKELFVSNTLHNSNDANHHETKDKKHRLSGSRLECGTPAS